MSATGYTHCPLCNHRDPDEAPESEYAGSVRIDAEYDFSKFWFDVGMRCNECGWSLRLTHENTTTLQRIP